MRGLISFTILLVIKVISRIFYRFQVEWIGELPPDPWRRLRILAVLNHTSLYEPILVGAAPLRLLQKLAWWGVLPVAAKTMRRKVGIFFRLIARNVVVVTRKRDHTWQEVLEKIDHRAMVCILPEGRMMRPGGLDADGNPMTVRGGIADILLAIDDGTMLLVYSGGLHHIQAPGERFPRLFKTVSLRLEMVEIAAYRERLLAQAGKEGFKKAVIRDLEERRNRHCPGYVPVTAPRSAEDGSGSERLTA